VCVSVWVCECVCLSVSVSTQPRQYSSDQQQERTEVVDDVAEGLAVSDGGGAVLYTDAQGRGQCHQRLLDSHLYSTADPHAHARTHMSATTEQPHTNLGDPEVEGVLDGVTAGEVEGEVEPEADAVADGDDDADKVALAVSLWAWPWTNNTT
jgi:hypothetical protein